MDLFMKSASFMLSKYDSLYETYLTLFSRENHENHHKQYFHNHDYRQSKTLTGVYHDFRLKMRDIVGLIAIQESYDHPYYVLVSTNVYIFKRRALPRNEDSTSVSTSSRSGRISKGDGSSPNQQEHTKTTDLGEIRITFINDNHTGYKGIYITSSPYPHFFPCPKMSKKYGKK